MEYLISGYLAHGGEYETEEFPADNDDAARGRFREAKEKGVYKKGTVQLTRLGGQGKGKSVVLQPPGT